MLTCWFLFGVHCFTSFLVEFLVVLFFFNSQVIIALHMLLDQHESPLNIMFNFFFKKLFLQVAVRLWRLWAS